MAENAAVVTVGEIKSTPRVADASNQLLLRCETLRAVCRVLYPNVGSWVFKGYLFVPKLGRQSARSTQIKGLSLSIIEFW